MRLFVALELPDAVRGELAARGASLAVRDDALRALPEASLHVTLCFLGERPEAEAPEIAAVVRAIAGPPVPLAVGDPLMLPPRRPRVLAVRLEDSQGALAELQRAAADGLVALGVLQQDARPFLGHVTLARVRRGGRPLPPPQRPLPPLGRFTARHVTLFRSRPGSVYEPLAHVELVRRARATE